MSLSSLRSRLAFFSESNSAPRSCRGAVRPLDNEHHHSSQRFTTRSTSLVLLILPMCLFVLRPHLWLNLTEMKDADKVPFLNSPVSPTGLFGPAVEGFAERFTAAQKSSQAMRHFLPKHSSSAAALNHPKMASTQQPAKATPPAVQTPSPSPAAHARPDATHQNSAGLNASGVFLINGTGRGGGKVPLQPDHPSKSLCYASYHPVKFRVRTAECL